MFEMFEDNPPTTIAELWEIILMQNQLLEMLSSNVGILFDHLGLVSYPPVDAKQVTENRNVVRLENHLRIQGKVPD